MITLTIKIKKRARNAASLRGAAKPTGKRALPTPQKAVNNGGAISVDESARSTIKSAPLSRNELDKIDAYWRAANYLSVGQIYLYDNPLLKKPLTKEHVKPRLLGHWGTTPGLNFIYAHLNRVIKQRDLNMIYIIGPGHGGPGLVANTYLEGTYTEFYPNVSQDEAGMKRFFTQFSFPGGIPSHVAPETPGSIHEGGDWDTRSLMRLAPPSIIPISLSPAWLGMAKPRLDRSLQAGIRTSS